MKKVIFSIAGIGLLLFAVLIIYLFAVGGLKCNNRSGEMATPDISSTEYNTAPSSETATASAGTPVTMEEYFLSFQEISVLFTLKDGDIIGQLNSHEEGSPVKKLSCSYGAGNAMCAIKKIIYNPEETTFVVTHTKCVNGDEDGCAEKKSTDYRCSISNKDVKDRYPGERLALNDVVCRECR